MKDGSGLGGGGELRESLTGDGELARVTARLTLDRPGRHRPKRRTDPKPDLRPSSGPLGEDPRHPRQDVVQSVLARHALGELREHLVGGRSLAIDEAVGQALGTFAHGVEGQSDHRGGEHGQEGVVGGSDGRPDADHERHVDGGEERGEQSVDERLADDDVDLVQAVLQYGDRDGCPQQHERQALEDGDGHGRAGRAGEERRDERGDHERGSRNEPLQLQTLVSHRRTEPCDDRDEGCDQRGDEG